MIAGHWYDVGMIALNVVASLTYTCTVRHNIHCL